MRPTAKTQWGYGVDRIWRGMQRLPAERLLAGILVPIRIFPQCVFPVFRQQKTALVPGCGRGVRQDGQLLSGKQFFRLQSDLAGRPLDLAAFFAFGRRVSPAGLAATVQNIPFQTESGVKTRAGRNRTAGRTGGHGSQKAFKPSSRRRRQERRRALKRSAVKLFLNGA